MLLISSLICTTASSEYINSSWPKCHKDPGNTAATDLPGLFSDDVYIQNLFDPRLRSCMGIYVDGNGSLWGTSETSFFKLHKGSNKDYEIVDSITKDISQIKTDVFFGIYSFVADDGVYYSYMNDEIIGISNIDAGDPYSKIEMKYRAQLPLGGILALGIVNNRIVFVTDNGAIGAMTRELDHLLDYHDIDDAMTNAFAVDGRNYIYILSATELIKYQLKDDKFSVIWRTKYDDGDTIEFVERPSKKGSGTTPSIMKVDGKEYVAIGDGSINQNLLIISVDTGEIVAKAPVVFTTGSNSYTEQSLTISGNRIIVVQNAYTPYGDRLVGILRSWNAAEASRKSSYTRVQENSYLMPVMMGDNPVGYVQFEFKPDQPRESRLNELWNTKQSCPNAIPTISTDTNCVYCVGKTRVLEELRPNIRDHSAPVNANGIWSIACIDMDSGERRKYWPISYLFRFNSMYAGTQIIGKGVMAYGTLGGVVVLTDLQQ